MNTLCSCFGRDLIWSILYIDFMEKKLQKLMNFVEQVDEIMYINIVDFQYIKAKN